MRDRRRQKTPGDLIDGRIVVRENQHPAIAVLLQKFLKFVQLRRGCQGQPLLLSIGGERRPPFSRLARFLNKSLPTRRSAKADPLFIDESPILLPRLSIL